MNAVGGAALGLGATGAGMVMLDPYMRNTVLSEIRMMASKSARDKLTYSKDFNPPQAAVDRADVIAESLLDRGFDPRNDRLAISATGGTGKTTTAKLLAQKLKMKYAYERSSMPAGFSSIAPEGTVLQGRQFTEAVQNAKTLPKGSIYEQTYLVPTVDPDRFDAMVYLHRDPEDIYAGLLKRQRGAGMRHFVDYPLLDSVIRSGYEETSGRSVSPQKGVHIKIKPYYGYKADKKIDKALVKRGIPKENIPGMTRLEKLYALQGEGDRVNSPIGRYIAPEYNKGKINAMLAILGGGTLAGALIGARR